MFVLKSYLINTNTQTHKKNTKVVTLKVKVPFWKLFYIGLYTAPIL